MCVHFGSRFILMNIWLNGTDKEERIDEKLRVVKHR